MGRDVVFIFGAGASADIGLPTMNRFAEKVKELANGHEGFDDVVKWLDDPRLVNCPKSSVANMEEMFSVLQMQQEIGRPGAREQLETLVTVIAHTYEKSCLPGNSPLDGRWVPQDRGYVKLYRALRGEYESKWLVAGEPPFSFITFNYDLGLEAALHSEFWQPEMAQTREKCKGQQLDAEYDLLPPQCAEEIRLALERHNLALAVPFARYGLINRPDAIKVIPLILKLHGSINWGICPECGNVQEIAVTADRRGLSHDVIKRLRKTNCPWHPETKWNGFTSPRFCYRPLLIPPTWSKGGQSATLRDLWRQAVQEIESASRIVFVGYSLPPTDAHVRFMLKSALASRDSERLKVMVVNLNTEADPPGYSQKDTQARYEDILGIPFGSTNRYVNKPFADAVEDIIDFVKSREIAGINASADSSSVRP